VTLLGLALAASTSLSAVPVNAAGTPDLGLKVPAHAHAHKATTVSWHAFNRGSDTIVLQGYNNGTWVKVHTLHGTKGTSTIPAVGIGIFDFRLAAYSKSGKLITAVGRKLHVFGKVKWSSLFQTPKDDSGDYRGFHYVYSFFSNDVDYTALKVTGNYCSSIHIVYVPGNSQDRQNDPISGEATMKLGRHGRSTITSTTTAQHKATVGGKLTLGKPWSVNLSEPGNGTRLFTWYVNGSGICDQTRITDYGYNQN
ncbi:MAG TPA: hypothetical protein VHE56_04675, partial [Mycobacteriales bacterium]|nr:hypothetical protein [Mycobacteriales bacterium]